MRDAEFHRATLDSIRRKLPHPERYRLVLAALLTFGLASDESPETGYVIFRIVMATICFLAIVWLLIDYASMLARAGVALIAFVLVFAPAFDPSSDLELKLGFVAFVAAAAVGGVTAVIEKLSGHSETAVQTHALRDIG